MARDIFISVTEEDAPIANAVKSAIERLFVGFVSCHCSTDLDPGAGIRHGADWFEWINSSIQNCDFALVLLTPASINKPWLVWEAGAVHGAAVALNKDVQRMVRPLVYVVSKEQLPSPFQHSNQQFLRGDLKESVEAFFNGLFDDYIGEIPAELRTKVRGELNKLDEIVTTYMEAVHTALLRAPSATTSALLDEWLARLDRLLHENRRSEAEHLYDWMEIAFGRHQEGRRRPLDFRLHTRLADMYRSAGKYGEAVEQLELARELVPRDLYILRTLGKAYIDSKRLDDANGVIDRVRALDAEAFVHNPECAALLARWHRERKELTQAADVLGDALVKNEDSYYLANLLGEVCLELKTPDGQERSRLAFREALTIIERLQEDNVWTNATAANAAFVVGDDAVAAGYLTRIAAMKPGASTVESIERGLRKLAAQVDNGEARLPAVLAPLHR